MSTNSTTWLETELKKLQRSKGEAPVISLVNKIICHAIEKKASDIHFEPFEKTYRVRIRLDGILHNLVELPTKISSSLTSRLKIMASIDISERRIPQDGRFKFQHSDFNIDFRVSSCPTLFGEKVVLRILDPSSAKLGIDVLGYSDKQKQDLLSAIQQSQGLIIVTGPTGSGKTVSLYTALNILNTAEKNISTVEDPVEINLPGVNQVNINPKAGLTFASALRSFLRQDPDIIMVGEIRDAETAEIAIKAAQTGHLVLSTLHTNSAAETINRLINMGIANYNIASSIKLVVAQRLARKLCPDCKKPQNITNEALKKLGINTDKINNIKIFEAVGCDKCTLGYKGRVGIYEVLPIDKNLQEIIIKSANSVEIENYAQQIGVNNLRQDALSKVITGITSFNEINRITKG